MVSVAYVFEEDMVSTCNHSAPVKRIFSQSGIVDVNFSWLANIKKIKLINKTTVAVLLYSNHTNQNRAQSLSNIVNHYA